MSFLKPRFYVFLFLTFLPLLSVAKQGGDLAFETIGDKYAIPHGVVTALLQDKQGFIWIGTQQGLVRYDGYRYRLYKYQSQTSNSIGGDYIRAIYQSQDDKIWIGTMNDGVSVLDPNTDKFYHYRHQPDVKASISSNQIKAITADPEGGMWFATGNGLNYLAPGSKSFVVYDNNLLESKLQSLLHDKHNRLWVGSRKGLYYFDLASKQLVLVGALAQVSIEAIYQDLEGRLWLGTKGHGIYVYSTSSKEIVHIATGDASKHLLSHPWIFSFVQPSQQRIWAASLGGGVNVIDTKTLTVVEVIQHDPVIASSINLNSVSRLMIDRSGLLWLGTWGGGLNRHNVSQQAFRVLQHSPKRAYSLSNPDIHAILQLTDGRWLIGTGGSGVDILDSNYRRIANLGTEQVTTTGKGLGIISGLAQRNEHQVWLASVEHGLYLLSLDDFSLTAVSHTEQKTWPVINQLLMDDSTLWVATHFGLFSVNDETKLTTGYLYQGAPFEARVNTMVVDGQGDLWLGTHKGLYFLKQGSRELIRFNHDPLISSSISSDQISGLLVDSKQRLWVDTAKGLDLLITHNGSHAIFESASDKLQQPGLYLGGNLQEDEKGNIWTQWHTFNPNTWQHWAISQADGADIGTVWTNSHAKASNGQLLFGGTKGVLVVTPSLFNPKSYQPPLAITELKVDGKKRAIESPLVLTPSMQGFSLEFTAFDYAIPRQNKYAYKLKGYNETWIYSDADNRYVTYTNLAPGEYQLQLKGSNHLGEWSDKQLSLAIVVEPALYQTFAFKLVVLITLLSIAYVVYLLRVNQLARQQHELREQVKAQTKNLEKAHQNLATISEIGKDITATLDLNLVLEQLFEHSQRLMQVDIFGIGLYREEQGVIDIELAVENGIRLKPYQRSMKDKDQLAVWSISHNQSVLIKDADLELDNYIDHIGLQEPESGFEMEGGAFMQKPCSYIYVPLTIKQNIVGIITVQSYQAQVYGEKQLKMMQALAAYAAIAVDNADKLQQLDASNKALISTQNELKLSYKRLEEVSVTDQLTGLKNRHFLLKQIGADIDKTMREYRSWEQDKRQAMPTKDDMVFFLIDLDHFKAVNDTHGHKAGDIILMSIKEVLLKIFRESDYLIRWGGEEFLVVARFTQREQAPKLAERIRKSVENYHFAIDKIVLRQTCSIGFACFPFVQKYQPDLTWEQVIEIADKCLYAAKNTQRNAWLGVYGAQDSDSETFMESLFEDPGALLNAKAMRLVTSISPEKTIIWQ
ncbi:ligand-binding sensor domain-containing diguanylate cyclase [Litorilituus sediminis]|uniref:diguanylate cyclase n=1 Tax=Litorilituus sediminis TaxID=718192 RepID=A0A4P6P4T0_9GAMM|nr:diguanylate cyclase [Litorilituus sediminis]QBG36561.1 diguanylate cyclase [Litorilituus sediminis]